MFNQQPTHQGAQSMESLVPRWSISPKRIGENEKNESSISVLQKSAQVSNPRKRLNRFEIGSSDINKSLEFIQGLKANQKQKNSLENIEYLSRDNVSMRDFKAEQFLKKQRNEINQQSQASVHDEMKSNLSGSDDIVMDLASENNVSDMAEQQLITKYIDN